MPLLEGSVCFSFYVTSALFLTQAFELQANLGGIFFRVVGVSSLVRRGLLLGMHSYFLGSIRETLSEFICSIIRV